MRLLYRSATDGHAVGRHRHAERAVEARGGARAVGEGARPRAGERGDTTPVSTTIVRIRWFSVSPTIRGPGPFRGVARKSVQ